MDLQHMSNVDLALSVALGIGLAAATGFRLFLPLLVLSAAAYTGHVSLNESFAWLGTPAAMIMLGTAAIVEIAAFYIPGVDNLLDTLATPGAVVAGTIASAATMTDLPPMLKWTTAVIAGGGVAGVTQGLTAMLRAKSTVLTGGLGNSMTFGRIQVNKLQCAPPILLTVGVIASIEACDAASALDRCDRPVGRNRPGNA